MEQCQIFTHTLVDPEFQYNPLDENDKLVFQENKHNIDRTIRETFPSIPANFQLKPVLVNRIRGCGMFYKYKVALPDNKFAKVSFNTGGMYIAPPGVENYQPPEPTIEVDENLTSTPDE